MAAAICTSVGASAQAASRDGTCDAGEFCYYFNSNQQGSVSDFTGSLATYGDTQPGCYEFKGSGTGQGICVKNNAASVWNRSDQPVTVFFNSNYGGASQTIAPNTKANLNPTLKNNDASHRFGAPANSSPPSGGSGVGGPIKRAEVLTRGKFWVDKNIPYSMSNNAPDPQGRMYRTDCSGFVSMALHLSQSHSTVDLPSALTPISWSQLQPGDVVGTLGPGTGGSNGHVVIFNGWVDSAHTRFHTLEERGGAGAVAYQRPVAFKIGSFTASPYRYPKIQ